MKKLLSSIVTASLVFAFTIPMGSFAWATGSEKIAKETNASVLNEVEPEADLPYELFEPSVVFHSDEIIVAKNDAAEPQADTSDETVEVTPGWNTFGTCEWLIDDAGCLTIRPVNNGTVGEISCTSIMFTYPGGAQTYIPSLPWKKYDLSSDYPKIELISKINKVLLQGRIIGKGSLKGLFSGLSDATSIDGLFRLDTSQCDDLSMLFSECSSLVELNLSSFNTANVVYMSSMFSGCGSLTTLDLSYLDTSNVVDMGYMFSGCSFTSVDVSCLDTSKVKCMEAMFQGCRSLTSLDLSSFDTSSVVEFGSGYPDNGMFAGCKSLSYIDLSSFNTSKATIFGAMFYGCSSLKKLDLSSFDTRNGSTYDCFFDDSGGLEEIRIGEGFTFQKFLPEHAWFNTKGQQFYPADIPMGVADTYTSTTPHVSIKVPQGGSLALEAGGALQLSADVVPSSLTASIAWSSSDDRVASVDASGKVVAKAAGTATITAKAVELSDSVTVMVRTSGEAVIEVESVSLDKGSLTIVGQASQALTASVLPANATFKNVMWSSSDESVVRVNAQGAVMAVGKGRAIVTAKSADGRKSATCEVEVSNPITWVGFASLPTRMVVGSNYDVDIATRGDLPGATDDVSSVAWSSSDESIARILGSGVHGQLNAVSAGSCDAKAKVTFQGETVDLTTPVQIEWDWIERITLSESSKSIQVGAEGFTLEYGISNPSAAGRLDEIRWSTSSIADIQGGDGTLTITPKRTGREVLTLWGPGASAQFDLTVTPKVISISDDSDVEGIMYVNDSETAAYVGDAYLRIKDSDEKMSQNLVQLAVGSAGGISAMLDAYDIDLVDEEGAVVPLESASDAVTVFAKMSDPVKAVIDTHDLGVHYVDTTSSKAEAKNTWVDGDMIAFETTHFSTYAITATQRPIEAQPASDPIANDTNVKGMLAQTGDGMGIVLGGAACIMLCGIVALTVLSAIRRRKNSQQRF